jgi:DNA-binding CsgD family transcriptional regulator
MGFFLKPKLSQRYLHNIMLPSIGLIFLASNYVIFTEVGPILQWNVSFFWFYALLLLGFGISWIYAVAINKAYQKVKAVVSEKDAAKTALQSKLKSLSRKEHEVLNLILERKNNQQICDTLFISLSTLKSHINHIYKKLEVNRRQEILELLG